MQQSIILASTSPRRKQALSLFGIKFKVADSGYDEVLTPGLSHKAQVLALALGKAKAAAKKYPKAIIITADTMVSFRGKIIGKPKNYEQAFKMLKSFSGKSQTVLTGVVVMDAATGSAETALGQSIIYFKKLNQKTIKAYVDSKEPFDKAGGYNLQGRGFSLIKKVEGDFTNVLGLPMLEVYNALQKLGVEI